MVNQGHDKGKRGMEGREEGREKGGEREKRESGKGKREIFWGNFFEVKLFLSGFEVVFGGCRKV